MAILLHANNLWGEMNPVEHKMTSAYTLFWVQNK